MLAGDIAVDDAHGIAASSAPVKGAGDLAIRRRQRSARQPPLQRSPCSSSMTRNETLSVATPTSWIVQIFGCWSVATARASRSNARRWIGRHVRRALTATVRSTACHEPMGFAHPARAERARIS
jgi:hypothetical protein